jgi:thioredoxin 1
MILHTSLIHLTSAADLKEMISNHDHVMVCCGRMGPTCVPVYQAMTELRSSYPGVQFCDMAFDLPDAHVVRNLPECSGFMGLPFTIYYRNGRVVRATSGIRNKQQVKEILDELFV